MKALRRGRRIALRHRCREIGMDVCRVALTQHVGERGHPGLRECAADALGDPAATARALKALPLRLEGPRPLDEAISTAGGVRRDALDAGLMLRARPGSWCAGEMLDWDAPTGGYLLTACLATGRHAALDAADRS